VLLYYGLVFAAFAWNVLIVYLTLGFRHYSHYFTSIQLALNAATKPPRARCWPNGRASTRSAWTPPRSPASPSKIADHDAPQRVRRVLLVPDAARARPAP
jgi:hypothetical protein